MKRELLRDIRIEVAELKEERRTATPQRREAIDHEIAALNNRATLIRESF